MNNNNTYGRIRQNVVLSEIEYDLSHNAFQNNSTIRRNKKM